MREIELIKQKSIKERLDSIKRQKYYCNKCKSNHYYDSEIGRKHLNIHKKQQKQSLKTFLDENTQYFWEWQMVENIRYKLQREGFSEDEAWDWQITIERGQFANHKFKAHGYEWESRSGVMGAKGLRLYGGHAKIRIVRKLKDDMKTIFI